MSEYGLHWNFFFTLMFTSLLLALLPLHGGPAATAAAALSMSHQLWLSQWHVRSWLEGTGRDAQSAFDANREGVCSLPGYAALCYAGSAVAALLQPIETGHTRWRAVSSCSPEGHNSIDKQETGLAVGNQSVLQLLMWLLRISSVAAMCSTCMHVAQWQLQPISRRFCNLAYVLWIVREGLVLLLSCSAVELRSIVLYGKARQISFIEGLSRQQLAVFLAANVLTGIVNMSMDTLHASDGVAAAVLLVYCSTWAALPAGLAAARAQFSKVGRTLEERPVSH